MSDKYGFGDSRLKTITQSISGVSTCGPQVIPQHREGYKFSEKHKASRMSTGQRSNVR